MFDHDRKIIKASFMCSNSLVLKSKFDFFFIILTFLIGKIDHNVVAKFEKHGLIKTRRYCVCSIALYQSFGIWGTPHCNWGGHQYSVISFS
jgi:hypothetical protein